MRGVGFWRALSTRRQVASASKPSRAIASRPYRLRDGSAVSSVANHYGIVTDTPGFMKTAEVRHGSDRAGTPARGLQRSRLKPTA
jgi:hypothetical protein